MTFKPLALALVLSLAAGGACRAATSAPAGLSPTEKAEIDRMAEQALARTGVPSASIAVVKDGRLAYAKAYGSAELSPRRPATPEMRYAIGSVSKEFTAAAILVLAQEGKLSLEDPVGKYVPGLTDGDKITIRQILSHTSGYRDFWPQDYVFSDMRHPATPWQILDRWAKTPLDFQPGAEWQYSNTGYVLAGVIVEKVSGQPLMTFLREHVFTPLHMTDVVDFDAGQLTSKDPKGYSRFALGPARPAADEARGWMFAAGELAMTPSDLAQWDVSEIDHSLLSPASYSAQVDPVMLNSGASSGYGLGLFISRTTGRLRLEHGGEVSGFLSENRIYPDDKAAIVVFTNADFGDVSSALADDIEHVLFPQGDKTRFARELYDELRAGRLDRSRLTANANDYFSPQAVQDFHASLAPLGEPTGFRQLHTAMRGGMTVEVYEVDYPGRKLRVVLRALPGGKVEQFMVSPMAG